MVHLLTLLVCISSVEILIQLKFLSILGSILKSIKKVIHILPEASISDHWKEKVLPTYSLIIMKHSIQMFLILLFILSVFLVVDYFINGFLEFSLSLLGIAEAVVFAFGYFHLRKIFC